jgi:FkbM family methyltransferase
MNKREIIKQKVASTASNMRKSLYRFHGCGVPLNLVSFTISEVAEKDCYRFGDFLASITRHNEGSPCLVPDVKHVSIIDIGANVGVFSMFAYRMLTGISFDEEFFLYEPSPSTAEACIATHGDAFDLDIVGLGRGETFYLLENREDPMRSRPRKSSEDSGGLAVYGKPFHEMLARCHPESAIFVKCDCEGGERSLLCLRDDAVEEIKRRVRMFSMEIHYKYIGGNRADWRSWAACLGFKSQFTEAQPGVDIGIFQNPAFPTIED